ncbi:MAG: 2-hydroxyacyl-CoA dehydratase family protein [bacterium]
MKYPWESDKVRIESGKLVRRWLSEVTSPINPGEKVVYLFTSGAINELFASFGFRIVLPEINAIRCSVGKIGAALNRESEDIGFASAICAYMKTDLGLMTGPRKGRTDFGIIPPPDLLVIHHVACSTYVKWFEALARYFNCPVKIIDVPFMREDEPTDFDRVYVRGQIEEMIGFCEEFTGRKADFDRLGAMLENTTESVRLFGELLQYGKRHPAPFDGYFDAVSYMTPHTIWRGRPECTEYYRMALDEIEKRAKNRYSPVEREVFRLVFDGSPPWQTLSEFRSMFSDWNAVGVASTYPRVVCACEDLKADISDPLDLLTDLSFRSYYNWNLAKKRKFITDAVQEYDAEGVIFHSLKSCRPTSMGQLDIRNYFAGKAGIPALFLDSDLADPRYFSFAQIKNRIDTFLETLTRGKVRKTT